MARYIVNTRFTFSGVFEVEADNIKQAREIVMNDCGAVMGSVHTTNDDSVIRWAFDKHPDKEIDMIF